MRAKPAVIRYQLTANRFGYPPPPPATPVLHLSRAKESEATSLAATSTDSLHQTLVTALKASAWTIISDQPGEITVRLVRGHGPRAVAAKIFYTRSSYTITLLEAIDMDYDPRSNTISHKYNQWIRNLDQRISRALAK